MKKILQDKLRHLFCGDDGAALVITLGVFFFMYIFCAGVYAIGMAVKEKIHLQNACDAAAYSAAVVQADSISRIATLNRALGWTYAQMCRRQMDYIVARWLQGVWRKYNEDYYKAKMGNARTGCGLHGGPGWDRGYWNCAHTNEQWTLDRADLNSGRHVPYVNRSDDWTRDDGSVQARLENFEGGETKYLHIDGYLRKMRDSLFEIQTEVPTIEDLGKQIDQDKVAVDEMSDAIDRFARTMPSNIRTAALAILRANIPMDLHERCEIAIRQSENPLGDYFIPVARTEENERGMIGNGGEGVDSGGNGNFGIGSKTWFYFAGSGEGFQRAYIQHDDVLMAAWNYVYNIWTCKNESDSIHKNVNYDCPDWYSGSDAKADDDSRPGSRDYRLKNKSRFVSATARPKLLDKTYFGPNGTITIGIVRHQTSPWYSVFRNVSENGIYAAFNPVNDLFCFASAKAGYKLFRTQDDWERYYEGDARAWRSMRDYCVDWKPTRNLRARHGDKGSWEWVTKPPVWRNGRWIEERVRDSRGYYLVRWFPEGDGWRQGWNLTQSDWDAVMVPVCKGGSAAREIAVCTRPEYFSGGYDYRFEPVWTGMDTGYLQDIVNGNGWVSLKTGQRVLHSDAAFGIVCAGGVEDPDPDGAWGENFDKTSSGWNGWWDIPRTAASHTHAVKSRWNIQFPGEKLKWTEIMTKMFH